MVPVPCANNAEPAKENTLKATTVRSMKGTPLRLGPSYRNRHAAALAALSGRDRTPVRACPWMPQKGADAVGHFGAQNMLERAGVRLDRIVVAQGQRIHKQALSEARAAYHAAGARVAIGREFHLTGVGLQKADARHSGHQPPLLGIAEVLR